MANMTARELLEYIHHETPLHEVATRILFRDPPYHNADGQAEPDQAAQAFEKWRGFSKDISQRIKELLTVLWSDIEFWREVVDGQQDVGWIVYSLKHYGLAVPAVPSAAWIKMARQKKFRDQVFDLVTTQHWRLISWRRLLAVGEEDKFVALLREYLNNPAFDKRTLTASKGFPPATLELLAEIAHDIAADVKWLLKHPGQLAPVGFRKQRGRPHSVEHAEELERLVLLVKLNPTKGDLVIAKMFDPKAAADAARRKEAGRPLSEELVTQRKKAGEARLLAIVRDGADVVRHVDEAGVRGRRPRVGE